jgi:hypothetical protein
MMDQIAMNESVIDWQSILSGMFTDPRFRPLSQWRWYGEVEGRKVGVALATRNFGYDTFALNKDDTDRLLAAKRDKVDEAFVVAAHTDKLYNHTYAGFRDAEVLHETVLKHQRPKKGSHGEFWVLTLALITGGVVDPRDEEPW